jgi:Ca-activated chloride channel homolog
MRRLIAATAIALAGSAAVGAQQEGSLAKFSSRVQLVEVYATVTDERGELVTGLRQNDFQVYENNQRQDISTFAAGEFPLTVALGIDRSWSMAGKPLELAKQASRAFLNELKTGDRSMLVAISSTADVIAPLSADRVAQGRAISMLDPWSTTALRDAVVAALDRLEPESGRQALVLFSDGNDRYSAATEAEVIARARRSNALIYPITIGKQRPPFLAELAVITGGRSFLLKDATELEKTLSTVARELRYQYLLGYAPTDPIEEGVHEWRPIRVALTGNHAGLRVRARDGYTTN